MDNKCRKAAVLPAQQKKDEASMRKSVVELCSELPDMQLEPNSPIIENVQKVIVHMKELEKRDPTMQLKEATKEVAEQIVYQIADMRHLLETTTESWSGIEHIREVEEVHEEIQ